MGKENLIKDNENYYFFRALNMSDNDDLEKGLITNKKGSFTKIRTDRQRWEENENNPPPKYNENDNLTLEEICDHIKENYRRDTNCISLSSSASISIKYGENYKDKYVMVKIPKDEMGSKVVNAEEYVLNSGKTDEKTLEIANRAKDSEEYIHYGEISGNKIINIPKDKMKRFETLQQEGNSQEIVNQVKELYKIKNKEIDKESLALLLDKNEIDINKCDNINKILKTEEEKLKEGETQTYGDERGT